MPMSQNDDNGSLFIGTLPISVGARIRIAGEPKERTVTFVIKSKRGHRLCFRGQGAVPVGVVEWELVVGTSTATTRMVSPGSLVTAPAFPPSTRPWNSTPLGPTVLTGFDSAWGTSALGALVSIRSTPQGWELAGPRMVSWEAVLDEMTRHSGEAETHVIAIDQPLIVKNAYGRRPVEDAISPLVGRFRGGVQPSSRVGCANLFGDNAPIWRFLGALDAVHDPAAVHNARGKRCVFEVYPALGNLGLFPSSWKRGMMYKYNPTRDTFSLDDWRELASSVAHLFEAIGCPDGASCASSLGQLPTPRKADQDLLDALICCLHAHSFWSYGLRRNVIVGDIETGYVVIPTHDQLSSALRADSLKHGVAFTSADANKRRMSGGRDCAS